MKKKLKISFQLSDEKCCIGCPAFVQGAYMCKAVEPRRVILDKDNHPVNTRPEWCPAQDEE